MRVNECCARAERYERVAQRLHSSEAKQVYENLARQWRELAKRAESHERASEGAPGNQLPGHASAASRAMSRIHQFLVALASTHASARVAWPPHPVRR